MQPGYHWAIIVHTGEIEIVEVIDGQAGPIVLRIGSDMTLAPDQVEFISKRPMLVGDGDAVAACVALLRRRAHEYLMRAKTQYTGGIVAEELVAIALTTEEARR